MCQGAIRAINNALYNETTTHALSISLLGLYTLNVVKLINDIVTSDPVYCYDCRTPNGIRRSVFLLLGDESRKCCK